MEMAIKLPKEKQTYPNFIFIAIILGAMLGGFIYLTWVENSVFYQVERPKITLFDLEELHGLRVEYMGVSVDGSTVEYHLDVVDPYKVNQLMADPDLTFGIWIEESDTHLMIADEEVVRNCGSIRLQLENSGGIVQPGMNVNIVFGNLFVESIPVQQNNK
jgi:hypothetical protein